MGGNIKACGFIDYMKFSSRHRLSIIEAWITGLLRRGLRDY